MMTNLRPSAEKAGATREDPCEFGTMLSHHHITEKLGEGGMGRVYESQDTRLDRFVAVKVLPPEKVADPERKRQ